MTTMQQAAARTPERQALYERNGVFNWKRRQFKSCSILSLILTAAIGVTIASNQASASTTFYLVPSVKDHHCGANPYFYSHQSPHQDVYMQANGQNNCNTITMKSQLRPTSVNCDFYIGNPDHGGIYKGTTNAYVGIFSGQNFGFAPPKVGVKRVVPIPPNTYVYLGTYTSEYVTAIINAPSPPSWDTYFEIGDNNGSSGVIGMSQIKEVCPN
jgi:hypothetical protein